MTASLRRAPGKHRGGNRWGFANAALEIVGETIWEAQDFFQRRGITRTNAFWCAFPTNLYAPEQIGLRPRHAEQSRWIKAGTLAKNIWIRVKAHKRATAIMYGTQVFDWALRYPA